MHQNKITFQMAAHYLPRIALRLESLYRTIEQAYFETHPIIHHYALNNIIEMIKLIEKPEIKSRFLKELMRIEHALNKSNVFLGKDLQDRIVNQIHTLSHVAGPFGDKIHRDTFLQSIRLSQQPQQTDNELYSPQLLYWLEATPSSRQSDLKLWLNHLQILNDTVATYLRLLRETAQFEHLSMHSGFYQRQLTPKCAYHLVLLRVDKSEQIVPRMQIGHHGLSLRLCNASTMNEIREKNVEFELGICQI